MNPMTKLADRMKDQSAWNQGLRQDALVLAIMSERPANEVEALLLKGAQPNTPGYVGDEPALPMAEAIWHHDPETVRVLLKHGGVPTQEDVERAFTFITPERMASRQHADDKEEGIQSLLVVRVLKEGGVLSAEQGARLAQYEDQPAVEQAPSAFVRRSRHRP
jgi:hypothetical protein